MDFKFDLTFKDLSVAFEVGVLEMIAYKTESFINWSVAPNCVVLEVY